METQNTQGEALPDEIESKVHCYACDDEILESDSRSHDGEAYCDDCFADRFFCCDHCDEDFSVDDAREFNDRLYCEDCYHQNFFECYGCGCYFDRDESFESNRGSLYCSDCYHDRFFICNNCNSEYRVGEAHEDNFCSECCEGCDDCRNATHWTHTSRKITSTEFKKIKFPRFFGVELESCSVNEEISSCDTSFSSVHDSSVDGPEYVSQILQGDTGFKEIQKLCEFDLETNTSCGFHLHLDAHDIDESQVINIAYNYSQIEDFLFCLVAPSRRDNSYCKRLEYNWSLLLSNKDRTNLIREVYKSDNIFYEKYHNKRYEFLNIHSYFYRRTLEIRLHQGTFNPEKIRNWVNLHQAFFELFKNKTYFHWSLAIEDLLSLVPEIGFYLRERLLKFKHSGHGSFLAFIDKQIEKNSIENQKNYYKSLLAA